LPPTAFSNSFMLRWGMGETIPLREPQGPGCVAAPGINAQPITAGPRLRPGQAVLCSGSSGGPPESAPLRELFENWW
jgi:hypothetical protein